MSDEKKVNEETTAPKAPKRWPIVVAAFAVVIIAVAVAFLHLHEEPRFCSTICHTNMTKYVDGYYSEDPSMTVTAHENADVTCLGCHWSQAKLLDLVHEVVLYVTDSYPNPLHDMKEFVSDEFCGACHDGVTAPTKEEATAGWTIDPHADLNADVEAAGYGKTTANPMHEGLDIACGDCHSIHKQSTMVCAECHDDVEVPAYWAVPENEAKAATAETFGIYDPHGNIPTAEEVPMHEGQDFSCMSCHETQTVQCAQCHDVYIEENLPEGWTLATSEAKAATAETYGMFDPHTNTPDTAMHASVSECESCHAENVLQCAMCHADYFTDVPEGWSLPAATNQLWPAPLAE